MYVYNCAESALSLALTHLYERKKTSAVPQIGVFSSSFTFKATFDGESNFRFPFLTPRAKQRERRNCQLIANLRNNCG